MTTTEPSLLRDPALPAFPHLLEGGGAALLEAAAPAVFGAGVELVESHAAQASWRPRRSLTVRYGLVIADGAGTREESLVMHTGAALPPQALRLTSEAGDVALWRIIDDPWLPGLRTALDPARVRELLQSLDVPPAPVHLRLRAYRAGRRAVVEVETGPYRLFMKVVRPDRTKRLQRRHRELEAVLPVPSSLGWSEEAGVVVLRAMEGETLRACLDGGAQPPDPAALDALLDRLPVVDDGMRPRSLLRAALGHVELLGHLAPDASEEIEELRRAFADGDASARLSAPPLVPVHGDFHEGQLLVRDGGVSALLDIDTVTLGHRMDDWALLVAHLDLHALGAAPAVAGHVRDYRDDVYTRARSSSDEAGLHLRIAASVFGQATGPFRVQSPAWPRETHARLQRALAWLAADAGAPPVMREPSSAPQVGLIGPAEHGS